MNRAAACDAAMGVALMERIADEVNVESGSDGTTVRLVIRST